MAKTLISQAVPLRAGKGKGQFLSEQLRPPDLKEFSSLKPSLLIRDGGKLVVTASPTLLAHPVLSLSSSSFFLKSAGDG